jgi:hypothetical protein
LPTRRAASILFVLLAAATVLVAVPGRAEAATRYCDGHEATLVGTRGDDVIIGTNRQDVIVTAGGNDIVFAGGGRDIICTGHGDDVVFGGPGNDVILTHRGDDFVYGGPGRDIILAGKGDDVVEGGPGVTRTRGNAGNDELWGTWCTPPESMQHFCRWPDLSADGIPDLPADWVLGKVGTLRAGDRGPAVEALQETLDGLGFDPGPADGVYGPLTATAVRRFQRDAGLEVDGVAGTVTKKALFGDFGDRKILNGGAEFDTCNSATRKRYCDSRRGLRSGAPRNPDAAAEWVPLLTEVFTDWGLEDQIDHAQAIVACESLADPMISTPAGSEHYWIGLFQHTDRYWDARAERAGIPGASPYDPEANAIVAAMLVKESGWGAHWACDRLVESWSQ